VVPLLARSQKVPGKIDPLSELFPSALSLQPPSPVVHASVRPHTTAPAIFPMGQTEDRESSGEAEARETSGDKYPHTEQ
jgi:hypothetical protein